RWILRHPDYVLVGGILSITVAALSVLLLLAGPAGRAAWPLVLALALLPAGEIAVNTMNQLIALVLPPGHLPRLQLRSPAGIPPQYRSAVVMPTLFGSADEVQESLERLEAQYLANREANLYFALLSDFTGGDAETRVDDDALLALAIE